VSRRGVEIVLRGVDRAFGSHEVLTGIELTVGHGEVVALLGASGSGKSTLLRLAAGLDRPTAGEVRIDGEPLRGIDSRTAFVFQEARLLPWRSLAGNVALGLPCNTEKTAGRARVQELLTQVGLDGFAEHRPRGVSGGMAQRTALARALARDPGALLLDEPFGALDALTRLRMQNLLQDLLDEFPTSVLLVTHDVEEALLLADRIALLGGATMDRGAHFVHELTVPWPRRRDRGDPRLAELRLDLLRRLGVDVHPPTTQPTITEENRHDAPSNPARPARHGRTAVDRLRVGGQR